jgi:glucose/arabinose dehydrogenase
MRHAPSSPTSTTASALVFASFAFVALLACTGACWAQAQVPTGAATTAKATAGTAATELASTSLPASKTNQLIERIQVNDGAVRIDEVRFGGETRSIAVVPKGGMPAYEVQPVTGVRTWKILGF